MLRNCRVLVFFPEACCHLCVFFAPRDFFVLVVLSFSPSTFSHHAHFSVHLTFLKNTLAMQNLPEGLFASRRSSRILNIELVASCVDKKGSLFYERS